MNKRTIAGLLAAVLFGVLLCGSVIAQSAPAPAQPATAAAPADHPLTLDEARGLLQQLAHTQPAPAPAPAKAQPEPLTQVESIQLRIAASESLLRQLHLALQEAKKEERADRPFRDAEAKIRAAHGYGSDVKITFDQKGNPVAVSR